MMYRLGEAGILRIADGALIPRDAGNIDYRRYRAWLDEGNTPLPTVVVAPQPDWDGFRLYCLGGVFAGDYPAIAKLIDTYTSFVIGIQYNNLALVNASLDRALADHTLDPTKGIPQATVDAIHAAMVANHLVEE